MASAQVNGITIEYDEHGEGEPLLLVMGLGGQLIDWPPTLIDELVGRGFRVIVFDNRDAGLSTESSAPPPTKADLARAILMRRPLRHDYSLDDMAGDAVGLLDALGIESAHVVGMSMGGMIAQLIAINHPQRVRSLTSVMSTTGSKRVGQPRMKILRGSLRRPTPTRETAVDQAVEVFRLVCGPTWDEAEFRALAERAVARSFRPAGTARQTAAILTGRDRTVGLRSIQVPTLVIHGLLDPLVRVSGGIATAKAITGSRLVLFNDMAHDLPRTRLAEIADEIASIAVRAGGHVRQPQFA
jgi:pimeloyl-ACP methyl ester carboxylesterase